MKKDSKSIAEDITTAISFVVVVALIVILVFSLFVLFGFSWNVGERLAMVLYGAA